MVLTSTYPRWLGDQEPGFVHELCKRLTGDFDVTVLGPHAIGALTEEIMDGVHVRRYRYAPAAWETLVNSGGIVINLKRRPWKWLLVPGFLLAQAWVTWKLIRRWHPDVIHAHWLVPQGFLVAALSRIVRRPPPYLVTSHGADLFALRGRSFNALKRFVVRRASAVTVVSHAMLNELASIGADVSKVEIQPMGVDLTERFTRDTSVPRSQHEILFVGRLVEKKGLRYLIDAMPAIMVAYPQAHLTVSGFGPEEPVLRNQVHALGLDDKVHFVGAVVQTDLPALYRRAAVFVAPFVQAKSGDQEGLGLVSVEAIGCGCPVIISDLATASDVLSNTTGVVSVPQRDSFALAQAVQRVLAAPEQYRNAVIVDRHQMMHRFDLGAVSQRYAQILQRLISNTKHE